MHVFKCLIFLYFEYYFEYFPVHVLESNSIYLLILDTIPCESEREREREREETRSHVTVVCHVYAAPAAIPKIVRQAVAP